MVKIFRRKVVKVSGFCKRQVFYTCYHLIMKDLNEIDLRLLKLEKWEYLT